MDTSMKGTGKITSVMGTVGIYMLMVKYSKANGAVIWLMELGSINVRTNHCIVGSGKMTFSMAVARIAGLMALSTRVIM